jgi:hypothetical protein
VLILTGANSAVGLRSMPARYLFLDEVDGYPGDVEGEGDPTLAYVGEVHELCAIAGRGDLAAGFIAKATRVAQIRRALLEARAAEDEAAAIHSQVRPARAEGRSGFDREIAEVERAVAALGQMNLGLLSRLEDGIGDLGQRAPVGLRAPGRR